MKGEKKNNNKSKTERVRQGVSEATLIERLIKQDESAFRQIIPLYQPAMRSLSAAIAGDSIADEIVQEAWLAMMRALPAFEQRSSLKTWLLRIVANEAKSRFRREKRSCSLEGLENDRGAMNERYGSNGHWVLPPSRWELATPEAILSEEELRECITLTVKRLPPLQGAALKLKELENYSSKEICNILDISASNIRVLLHRARNSLYETIDHFQATGNCRPCG